MRGGLSEDVFDSSRVLFAVLEGISVISERLAAFAVYDPSEDMRVAVA